MALWTFIHDEHTDVRGEPKMLKLTCYRCKQVYGWYQKDGPVPPDE